MLNGTEPLSDQLFCTALILFIDLLRSHQKVHRSFPQILSFDLHSSDESPRFATISTSSANEGSTASLIPLCMLFGIGFSFGTFLHKPFYVLIVPKRRLLLGETYWKRSDLTTIINWRNRNKPKPLR